MEMKTMSLFGIQPFEAPKRKSVQSIQLTVSNQSITIPNKSFEKFGEPKFVEVGFNDEKKFFGIKPVQTETKFSIDVQSTTVHQISRIAIVEKINSLRPWDMRFYNLILDKGQFDDESGYWLFDLDLAQEVTRTRRNRKGSK